MSSAASITANDGKTKDKPTLQRPKKYLIVGDIHGCLDELLRLVKKAGLPDMRHQKERAACPIDWSLVHVGDLVAKGPDSAKVVQYCIDSGAVGVLGNHDHQVLVCAKELKLPPFSSSCSSQEAPPFPGVGTPFMVGVTTKDTEHSLLAKQLTLSQLTYLRQLPLFLHLPHDATVVHAGVNPAVAEWKDQLPDHLLNMRNITSDGRITKEAGVDQATTTTSESLAFAHAFESAAISHYKFGLEHGTVKTDVTQKQLDWAAAEHVSGSKPKIYPWATRYKGPEFIVFGHDAARGLQRHNPHAIGLDTGCCYGKYLTGYIWPDQTIVEVAARRAYCAPTIPLTYSPTRPLTPPVCHTPSLKKKRLMEEISALHISDYVYFSSTPHTHFPSVWRGNVKEKIKNSTIHDFHIAIYKTTREDCTVKPEKVIAAIGRWEKGHGSWFLLFLTCLVNHGPTFGAEWIQFESDTELCLELQHQINRRHWIDWHMLVLSPQIVTTVLSPVLITLPKELIQLLTTYLFEQQQLSNPTCLTLICP